MLGSIPRDAGYTWEGRELKAHITLIWATGEKVLVPLDLWNSFEVKFSLPYQQALLTITRHFTDFYSLERTIPAINAYQEIIIA